MTVPSEMTNTELNRAIAEKLGWKYCPVGPCPHTIHKMPEHWHPPGEVAWTSSLPNYSGDVAAALGLLDEYDEADIWKDSTGWNCAFGGAFCHGKPFPRALSECWLTAGGNDG